MFRYKVFQHTQVSVEENPSNLDATFFSEKKMTNSFSSSDCIPFMSAGAQVA